jgi:hypothetical protein
MMHGWQYFMGIFKTVEPMDGEEEVTNKLTQNLFEEANLDVSEPPTSERKKKKKGKDDEDEDDDDDDDDEQSETERIHESRSAEHDVDF